MTTTEAHNKAFVLEALGTLFNNRDAAARGVFWPPAYIQHSAHIAPGREGLFELVKAAPKELHYENALILAGGDYVMLHGRFSGIGQPVNWVVVDILRIENGLIAEHWDVIQDEATRESTQMAAAPAIPLGHVNASPSDAHFGESGASEKATNECSIRWLSAECDVRVAWPLVGNDSSDELRVQE